MYILRASFFFILKITFFFVSAGQEDGGSSVFWKIKYILCQEAHKILNDFLLLLYKYIFVYEIYLDIYMSVVNQIAPLELNSRYWPFWWHCCRLVWNCKFFHDKTYLSIIIERRTLNVDQWNKKKIDGGISWIQ